MIKVMQEQLTERLLMLWRLTEDSDGDAIYKEAADRIAALEQAVDAVLALIEAHNASPCPQVFKVEVPAKYREVRDGD